MGDGEGEVTKHAFAVRNDRRGCVVGFEDGVAVGMLQTKRGPLHKEVARDGF